MNPVLAEGVLPDPANAVLPVRANYLSPIRARAVVPIRANAVLGVGANYLLPDTANAVLYFSLPYAKLILNEFRSLISLFKDKSIPLTKLTLN